MAAVLRVYEYSMGALNANKSPTDGGTESAFQFLNINIPVVIANGTATTVYTGMRTINELVTSRLYRSDTEVNIAYTLALSADKRSIVLTPGADTIIAVTQLKILFTFIN